jgi:MFS family permease
MEGLGFIRRVIGLRRARRERVPQTAGRPRPGFQHRYVDAARCSTSFNAAQMIGPAVAGLLIAGVGIGWAYLLNGLSFAAVLISMSFFRLSELRTSARAHRTTSGFVEGLRYVWRKPDLRAILITLFLIGTFGLNFPIFISTMAVNVFHSDARGFGLLSSIMAVGTLSGAFSSLCERR